MGNYIIYVHTFPLYIQLGITINNTLLFPLHQDHGTLSSQFAKVEQINNLNKNINNITLT